MRAIVLTIISILSIFQSFAQGSFEGKIVLRAETTSTNEVSDITWYMKNGQHLLSYVNTGKVNSTYSLLSKAGKLEMINERGRVNIPGNSLKKVDYDFSNHKLLNKEGNKLINEFNCIKYTIEGADHIAECWIADDADIHVSDQLRSHLSGSQIHHDHTDRLNANSVQPWERNN